MDLHLLGIAHNPVGPEHCRDPFGELVWVFGKALRSAGHKVIFYGAEGSDTACCDEFVPCVAAATHERLYGTLDRVNHQFDSGQGWTGDDEAWREFKMRATWELESRVRDKAPAVILASVGWALADLCKQFMGKHVVVEPLIGYNATFAEHRVFPSHAWHHFMMADEAATNKVNKASPAKRDAVIPHPIDPDLFPFKAEKGDYALVIGRVNESKGIFVAAEACKQAGVHLKVVGQLPAEPEGANVKKRLADAGAEWLPSVGPKERAELMGNARALLACTIYVEPFGMIVPQAQACGTPVICTGWGGVAESVAHGYTGFHCNTVAQIAEALRRLPEISPGLCRAWALAKFGLAPVGKRYSGYLDTIMGKSAGLDWMREPHPLEIIAALASASHEPQPTGDPGSK